MMFSYKTNTGAIFVAGMFGKGLSWTGDIDKIKTFMYCRVDGTKATGAVPWNTWFILINVPIDSSFCVQFAFVSGRAAKLRVRWDDSWDYFPWMNITLSV